ncbi:MAG: NfeD family protein [Cyanobacteria bacterium J06642_11]
MRKQHQTIAPSQNYLGGIGTAETLITDSIRGRIRLFGSWWPALARQPITIQPGQQIRVVSRVGLVLMVDPI